MDLPLTFEFKGVKYGLENDWTELPWGAWVDFEVLSQDIYNNIPQIMAILYRPVISEKNGKYTIAPYKSKDIKERTEIFQELPVKYWITVSGFFLQISYKYVETIKNSLKQTNKLNRMLMTGWGLLPKWVRPKRLQDFIFTSRIPSQKRTL
jgi:hypothetical protein